MGIEKDIRDVNVAYYYPSTVSPSKEFKALAEVENPELKALWKQAWKWYCNTFVYDIDVDGAERWESMLSITPAKGATLTERKIAILARINASLPYTERSFQDKLDGIYGKGNIKLTCHYNEYAITLDLVPGLLLKWKKIKTYARVIVPANLSVMLSNTKRVEAEEIYAGGWVAVLPRISIDMHNPWTADSSEASEYYAGYVAKTERMWI